MQLQELRDKLRQYTAEGILSFYDMASASGSFFLILESVPFVDQLDFTPTQITEIIGKQFYVRGNAVWGVVNDVEVTASFKNVDGYIVAGLTLQLPSTFKLDFPYIDWISLDSVRLILQAKPRKVVENELIVPVTGAIAGDIGTDEEPISIKLVVEGSNDWRLQGDFESINFSDLTHALSLIGNFDDIQIPPGLEELPQIALYEVVLGFNPSTKSVSIVEIEFGSSPHQANGRGWEIVQGIRLESGRINLFVVYPTNPTLRGVGGIITARWILGSESGADIQLTATYPENKIGWQFEGSTRSEQDIPFGRFIVDLARTFNTAATLPTAIADLTIEDLKATFDTHNKNFTFHGEAKFLEEEGQAPNVALTAAIDFKNQSDGSYSRQFGGHIAFGKMEFALIFDSKHMVEATAKELPDTAGVSQRFIAAYHDSGGGTVNIHELLSMVSREMADLLSTSLSFTIKDALFAYQKSDEKSKYLFSLDVDGGLDLANLKIADLPLIGRALPHDQTLKLSFQLLVVSQTFTAAEIGELNALEGSSFNLPQKAIEKMDLAISLLIGQETRQVGLPIGLDPQQGLVAEEKPAGEPGDAANVSSGDAVMDGAQWLKIQKAFGPLHIERIGLKFENGQITGLLDADLSFAGLTISLDGLSVSSPIDHLYPTFDLNGLGIAYSNGPLEIGGAFLKHQYSKGTKQYTIFSGLAAIRTEKLTLSAIGSFADIDGNSSLFIYAFLDYPLGGPAFFFVTGLAAGFGYNRALTMPTIDQVADFPLVEEAIKPAGPPNLLADSQDQQEVLTAKLSKLESFIPPAIGEHFLAIGVKFTSFKIVDSFALLIVEFGRRLEINLLGLSSLVMPPEVETTPVAKAQLVLKASFIPEQGFLGVKAQLTADSYLLSRDCHLRGGFAFYSWFSGPHAGDFVLTLGGYHPKFKVPPHYPSVPRLGFNWQVTDELAIKGSAYFALTGQAVMAGGHLEATWRSGDLHAWFKAGADFLFQWQPYHYDAHIYVDMGVSYTFNFFGTHTVSVELGADVHLWGPEFSGTAEIHYYLFSVAIRFGDDEPLPQKIDWATFKKSFLPKEEQICSITLQGGLIREVKEEGAAQRWIVNPKELVLATNSVMPSTHAILTINHNNGTLKSMLPTGEANLTLAIGSVGIEPNNLEIGQRITITAEDGLDGQGIDQAFHFTPILKAVPAALWGYSNPAADEESLLKAERLVPNTLAGYEIRPAESQVEPHHSSQIPTEHLQYETETVPEAFQWQAFEVSDCQGLEAWEKAEDAPLINQKRDDLLKALGLGSVELDFGSPLMQDVLVKR